MTKTEFVTALGENFNARLQAKTSWGRNEVMSEFNLAVLKTVMDEAPEFTNPSFDEDEPPF